MDAQSLSAERYQLGESPQWLPDLGLLQHVDILGRAIVRHGRTRDVRRFDADVGFALATRSGGLLVGAGRTLLRLDSLHGRAPMIGGAFDEPRENRFNDACTDPAGAVLAGTMSTVRRAGSAALYRVSDSGALRRLLTATLSNGLDWNLDATVLYYIDSTTQGIDAIAYDVDTGVLGARRRLVTLDPADGLPDGLTVDAEGGIWVALFGGGRIRRYSATGELDAEIALPVTNPTSLAFGGDDLATLFVTSARHRLTPEQLRREPLAGAVLSLRPGVRGRPSTPAS